jgi:hypothetical protein
MTRHRGKENLVTNPSPPGPSAPYEDTAARRPWPSHAVVTPPDQERIRVAAALADATLHAATHARHSARDVHHSVPAAELARGAVTDLWYEALTAVDAFTRVHVASAAVCQFDAKAVEMWLLSPDPSHPHHTVAQTLLDEDFDLYGFDKHVRLDALLAAAQHMGLFGVADHHVDLIHLAGRHAYLDRHRVTLTTPGHGVLCGPDLDTAHLLPEGLSGVGAAVHALHVTAEETGRLLTQRTLLADLTEPVPDLTTSTDRRCDITRPRSGRAFLPLHAPTSALRPPPLPAPPRRRAQVR